MQVKLAIVIVVCFTLLGCGARRATETASAEELKFLNKVPGVGVAKIGRYSNDGRLRVYENDDDVYIYTYESAMGRGYLFGLKQSSTIEYFTSEYEAQKLAEQKAKEMNLTLMADNPDIKPGRNAYYAVSVQSGNIVFIRPYQVNGPGVSYLIELIDYSKEINLFKAALKSNDFSAIANRNYYYVQPFLHQEIDDFLASVESPKELEGFTRVVANMEPEETPTESVLLTTRNQCLIKKRIAEIELIAQSSNINNINDVKNWTDKRNQTIDNCHIIKRNRLVANKTPKRGDLHSKYSWTFMKGDYFQGEAGANWVKTSRQLIYFDPSSMYSGYVSKRDVTPVKANISKSLIAQVDSQRRNMLNQLAKAEDKNRYSQASQQNTVSAYRQYLQSHPKGDFSAKAKTQIEHIYSAEKSFNGFMNAYKVNNNRRFLKLAKQTLINADRSEKVSPQLLDMYFETSVDNAKDIPEYTAMLTKTQNVSVTTYAKRLLKLPGVSADFSPENFLTSIEYRYILKHLSAKSTDGYHYGASYGLNAWYDGYRARISRQASCEYSHQKSKTVELGFFEGIGNAIGGSKVKNKNIYFDVFNCKADRDAILKISDLERKLTNSNKGSSWLLANIQWSDSRKNDVETYNKYGESNGGLREVLAQDDTGNTKFWTAICNNGNSGTVSLDDGTYCASGGNKEVKCTSNFSVRRAAQYLCQ